MNVDEIAEEAKDWADEEIKKDRESIGNDLDDAANWGQENVERAEEELKDADIEERED